MDYIQLKDIVGKKSFDIIHKLINKPSLDLYLKNYQVSTVDDDSAILDDVVDVTSVTSSDMVFIKTVDCIYTYDKTAMLNDDNSLGTKYTLTVYMRYDDVPDEILNNKENVVIKYAGISYESVDIQNAYEIIIQANLSI